MRVEDLSELHSIQHWNNIASILENGILSNVRAQAVPHLSRAMAEIQERRAKKLLPNGRRLHEYANHYINARNKPG